MRSLIFCFYFLCMAAVALSQNNATAFPFIENKGQVCDQLFQSRPDVLYSGTNGHMVFHLRNTGVSYQLNRVDEWKDEFIKSKVPHKIPAKSTVYRIDVNWLNSNANCQVLKEKESPDYNNYYLSNCAHGILNVKSYSGIIYKNIYRGIDLKWYQKNGALEYDFIAWPGSDLSQIKIEIKGAKKISINSKGELVIETPLGTIVEKAPVAYQENKSIQTEWHLEKNIASFKLGDYDKSSLLIIDPAIRVWGTYYGGTQLDYSFGLSTDASGNVFMGGYTQSASGTALATSGSHQSTYGGGTNDAFLVKFNAAGVRQWGTYYGGSTLDVITACATDGAGNIFVSGYTDSGNAVSTVASHQTTIGGTVDGFLAKFDNAGVLQWGTYYGGASNDYAYSCATDVNGNVFLAGQTASQGGTDIATPSGSQPVHGGSTFDSFLAKFNTNGVRQWGTYYGGTGNEYGNSCCTDNAGNVVLIGKTASVNSSAIATAGCHQFNNGGGNYDAFVAKFDPSGNRLWGTFYGGFGDEIGDCGATDQNGNVFLSGETDSNSSIATSAAHQPTIGGGFGDAYLVKFSSAGVRQWATYYGGANYEEGMSVSTDPQGNVFMCGQTSSQTGTIMATTGTHQSMYGGGFYDAYLVKFDFNGVRQWGTYYGGTNDDYGLSCKADAGNNIYMSGKTSSQTGNGIASANGHQVTYGGGGFDGFAVKFFECPEVNIDITILNNVSCNGGNDGAATLSANGGTSFTFTWLPSGSNSQTITGLTAGDYTCSVTNNCGAANTVTFSITEPPVITVSAITSNTLYCIGGSSTLTALPAGGSGAYTFTWSNGASTASTAVSPTSSTVYTVTTADYKNCTATATISQNVISCAGLNEIGNEDYFSVYPSPGTGLYTIKFPTNTAYRILIYNSLGQLVKDNITGGSSQVDARQFPAGVYYFRFFEKGNYLTSVKVIKE